MIKTIYRYPGAKNKLLPQILPYIEQSLQSTNKFCDAFVGGGSVVLEIAEKYPNIQLFCNDKDYFVYCFWNLISSNRSSDIEQLKELIQQKPTIELFYQLRATEPTNDIEAAYRSIFFNRTSFSGDTRRTASPIGGREQKSKYTVDCRYNADKIIQKMDYIHQLLVGRTIVSNSDINGYDVLDNADITVYFDPPYIQKGRLLYCEFMKLNEHISLSNKLKNKTNWILSYDNCQEVLDMYRWADIKYLDAKYCIKGKKQNWNETTELLIVPKSA